MIEESETPTPQPTKDSDIAEYCGNHLINIPDLVLLSEILEGSHQYGQNHGN